VLSTHRDAFLNNMLTKRKKENAIKDVRRHDADTGSPEAQVAILTKQIDDLSKHLKKNAKDFHSRRGLLQMVADRRKHLKYLEKKDEKTYKSLIKKLSLKK
jgi:small subunit ribosomal protein S15